MTHYLTDLTLELAAITKVGADIAITMWERQVGVTTPLVHAGLSLQKALLKTEWVRLHAD